MRWVRQHLVLIAGAWLLCQASTLGLTPVSLCAEMTAHATDQRCTCADGDGHECPMHHVPTSKSSCTCRSTNDATTVAVMSLLGPVAVLAHVTSLTAPALSSYVQPNSHSFPLSGAVIPDSPPPRA
jgi:hypothetical protein